MTFLDVAEVEEVADVFLALLSVFPTPSLSTFGALCPLSRAFSHYMYVLLSSGFFYVNKSSYLEVIRRKTVV